MSDEFKSNPDRTTDNALEVIQVESEDTKDSSWKTKINQFAHDPKVLKTVDDFKNLASDTAETISDFVKTNKTIHQSVSTIKETAGQVSDFVSTNKQINATVSQVKNATAKGVNTLKEGASKIGSHPGVKETLDKTRNASADWIERTSDKVVTWLKTDQGENHNDDNKTKGESS